MAVFAGGIAQSVFLPWAVISASAGAYGATVTAMGWHFWEAGVCTALGVLTAIAAVSGRVASPTSSALRTLPWLCLAGFVALVSFGLLGAILPANEASSASQAASQQEQQVVSMYPPSMQGQISAQIGAAMGAYMPRISVEPLAPLGVVIVAVLGALEAGLECRPKRR